jgi:hypothetical protein
MRERTIFVAVMNILAIMAFINIGVCNVLAVDSPDFQGVVQSIDFDFDNDKTVLYLDTATVVLNGIHQDFAVEKEYRIWVDSNGNLERHEEVVDDGGEDSNVMLIAGVIIVIMAILIIIAIVWFAMNKKAPEDWDD